MSRKEQWKRLCNFEDSVDTIIQGLNNCITKNIGRLITEADDCSINENNLKETEKQQ